MRRKGNRFRASLSKKLNIILVQISLKSILSLTILVCHPAPEEQTVYAFIFQGIADGDCK